METTAPISEKEAAWEMPRANAVPDRASPALHVFDLRSESILFPARAISTRKVFQTMIGDDTQPFGRFEVATEGFADWLSGEEARKIIEIGDTIDLWQAEIPPEGDEDRQRGVIFSTEKYTDDGRRTISRFIPDFPIRQMIEEKHLAPVDMLSQSSWLLADK